MFQRFNYVIILFSLSLLWSCNRDERIVIKGNLEGYDKGEMVFLNKIEVDTIIAIDSSELKGTGTFRFKSYYKQPAYFQLQAGFDEMLNLAMLPGTTAELTAKKGGLANADIRGSEASNILQQANQHLETTKATLDSLVGLYREASANNAQDKMNALDSMYNLELRAHKRFLIQLLLANPKSVAALPLLYQKYDDEQMVFGTVRDMQYFKIVTDSLVPLYPRSRHMILLSRNFNEMMENVRNSQLRQKIANAAEVALPDIFLPGTNDEMVSLESLKGKYVLLQFGQFNGRESMMHNLELREIYRELESHPFEIFQISLEPSVKNWKARTAEFDIPWISVIDTAANLSPSARIYNVTKVPTSFLINPAGEVMLRNPDKETILNIVAGNS